MIGRKSMKFWFSNKDNYWDIRRERRVIIGNLKEGETESK